MEQYLYSIVRYAPLSETGEFANVGIVLAGPKNGFFGFEMSVRKHKRVTDFFDDLSPNLYKTAIGNLRRELARMQEATKSGRDQMPLNFPDANLPNLFLQDLLRKREGIIRFSNVRLTHAANANDELQRLFKYYVGRDFVTHEYEEQKMEREIKRKLKSWNIASEFTEERLTDGVYSRKFPFVRLENGYATKVIKPISLVKKRPEAIIEHANKWAFAIHRLHTAGAIPDQVFLPVKAPTQNDDQIARAVSDARSMLQDSGAILGNSDSAQELQAYVD